jgi:hypothetical protein
MALQITSISFSPQAQCLKSFSMTNEHFSHFAFQDMFDTFVIITHLPIITIIIRVILHLLLPML